MNSNDWAILARDEKVHVRIKADTLLPLYSSIIKQFSNWHPVDWDNAVVALHIVYAWMPTIPDFDKPVKLPGGQARVVQLLNDARLRILSETEIDELKDNLVNNSVIGTSKLLHLLAPDKYAIWDSRVARVWFASDSISRARYATSKIFREYTDNLKIWLKEKPVFEQIPNIRKLSPHLLAVSDLRILELVLFHARS